MVTATHRADLIAEILDAAQEVVDFYTKIGAEDRGLSDLLELLREDQNVSDTAALRDAMLFCLIVKIDLSDDVPEWHVIDAFLNVMRALTRLAHDDVEGMDHHLLAADNALIKARDMIGYDEEGEAAYAEHTSPW